MNTARILVIEDDTRSAQSLEKLLKSHREVMLVSQAALGRSSRSNIATYLGMMDDIRKLLAEQPNVSVKISGLGIVDHAWSDASIRSLVLETIDIFGVARCMFASDVPTDKLYAGYDAIMSAFSRIVAGFAPAERDALFAANAERIYRLGGIAA